MPINLEIDEQAITVDDGTSVIDAADAIGIYIPRFCYHKNLSIAANCRMCLVEVEGVRKPLPACATIATEGMKVRTQSRMALDAQRAVMEFLLINHPLDCPICDQGGECELQDLSTGFGHADSDYDEPKRAVPNPELGPLIATEMTRCIHCTRCVRFGEEIAGIKEMGMTGRGGNARITTYVPHLMQSPLSGNVIDICPVGALTSKPARFQGRSWELIETPFISTQDCWGTNTFLHTRTEEYSAHRTLMRVVPRDNNDINEAWISDRDRFAYLGLSHAERVTRPWIKRKGKWVEADWQPVLLEIADKLTAIKEQQGAEQIGAVISPNASCETGFMFAELFKCLGSNNIDCRIRRSDYRAGRDALLTAGLSIPIADIERQDTVLIVGSDLPREVPLANLRVLKAVSEEAVVMAINTKDYHFNYPLKEHCVVGSKGMVSALTEIVNALEDKPSTDSARSIATQLKDASNAMLLTGLEAIRHPNACEIFALCARISEHTGASLNGLTEGANTSGLAAMGVLPAKGGLTSVEMLGDQPLRAYFLHDIEPEKDCVNPDAAIKALKDAGLVVCFSAFKTAAMEAYADMILPIAPVEEVGGTFVNVAGTMQTVQSASVPSGETKPAWKILRVLADFLSVEGLSFPHIDALRAALPAASAPVVREMALSEALEGVSPWQAPWISVNPTLRRSEPLARRGDVA